MGERACCVLTTGRHPLNRKFNKPHHRHINNNTRSLIIALEAKITAAPTMQVTILACLAAVLVLAPAVRAQDRIRRSPPLIPPGLALPPHYYMPPDYYDNDDKAPVNIDIDLDVDVNVGKDGKPESVIVDGVPVPMPDYHIEFDLPPEIHIDPIPTLDCGPGRRPNRDGTDCEAIPGLIMPEFHIDPLPELHMDPLPELHIDPLPELHGDPLPELHIDPLPEL